MNRIVAHEMKIRYKGKVRLLAGEDILFTAKNCLMEKEKTLIEEYFTQNTEFNKVMSTLLSIDPMPLVSALRSFAVK